MIYHDLSFYCELFLIRVSPLLKESVFASLFLPLCSQYTIYGKSITDKSALIVINRVKKILPTRKNLQTTTYFPFFLVCKYCNKYTIHSMYIHQSVRPQLIISFGTFNSFLAGLDINGVNGVCCSAQTAINQFNKANNSH